MPETHSPCAACGRLHPEALSGQCPSCGEYRCLHNSPPDALVDRLFHYPGHQGEQVFYSLRCGRDGSLLRPLNADPFALNLLNLEAFSFERENVDPDSAWPADQWSEAAMELARSLLALSITLHDSPTQSFAVLGYLVNTLLQCDMEKYDHFCGHYLTEAGDPGICRNRASSLLMTQGLWQTEEGPVSMQTVVSAAVIAQFFLQAHWGVLTRRPR